MAFLTVIPVVQLPSHTHQLCSCPTSHLETWLVHEHVREQHLKPPVGVNCLSLTHFLREVAKIHMNQWLQILFAKLLVSKPRFRSDFGERDTILQRHQQTTSRFCGQGSRL